MNNNPLNNQSYINKDFQTIYPELLDVVRKLTYKWDPTISNESDPGVLLIKLNAIIADKNNYNIDKNLLECFPDTVTQSGNAVKLFDQLGYSMHWYLSAEGKITLKWKSEKLGSNYGIYSYTVPQFTMVSDEAKEIVYTLLDSVELSTDGTSQQVDALQGVIKDYSFGSTTLLNRSLLDYKNRLYFPISNVAENGIFISDAVKNKDGDYVFTWNKYMDGWKKVDNLYIQPLGTKCYKFGVDQLNNSCYIEFPSDISDLMGEGIFLKYLQTNGKSGNISSKRVTSFYSDLEYKSKGSGDKPSRTLSKDIRIWNLEAITNGKDTETIDEAYIGYKRQVGTFDTLVTLRDYLNYIIDDEFKVVSNGIVADRNNDIQSSYSIVTKKDGYTETKSIVCKDANGQLEMSPYDLKPYLLEYSELSKFSTDTTLESQKLSMVKDYNKSFELKLGRTSDPLSTPLIIETYFSGAKSISHDFINKLPKRPLFFKNKFKLDLAIVPNSMVTQAQSDSIEKNVYEALYGKFMSKNIPFGKELSYENIYDVCTNADSRIKAVALENVEYTTYAVVYFDEPVKDPENDSVILYKRGLNEIQLPKKIPSDSVVEKEGKIDLDAIGESSKIALDIGAKSVLGGVTPLYENNDLFKLDIYQENMTHYENVIKATTNTDIEFKNINGNRDSFTGGVTLGENESLILYAPSLVDRQSYSIGVKYVYFTDDTYTGEYLEYIPANRDIILQQGQHLFTFWKDEDSKDLPYQYAKYGSGTILHSTTRLKTTTFEKKGIIISQLKSYGFDGEGQIIGELNDLLWDVGDTILSANKYITIKEINSVKLNDTKNDCYWITNNITTDTHGNQQYKISFEFNESLEDNVIGVTHYSNLDNTYLYVSNFDYDPANGNYTLDTDDKLFILRKIPQVVTSQAFNFSFQSLENVTNTTSYFNYEIVDMYGEGTTINASDNLTQASNDLINSEKSIVDKLSDIYTDSKVLPWGELVTIDETIDEVTTLCIPAHSEPSPNAFAEYLNDQSDSLLTGGFKINKLQSNPKASVALMRNSNGTSIYTYRLKTNEYFIYTNDNKDDVNILESGTTLNIEVPDESVTPAKTDGDKIKSVNPIELEVKVAVDVDELQQNGKPADEVWYTITANGTLDDDHKIKLKDDGRAEHLAGGMILEVVENQIIKLGAGTTVEVKATPITRGTNTSYDPSYDNLKIDSSGVSTKGSSDADYVPNKKALANYQIRYKSDTDTSYTTVQQLEGYNLCWDAYTILNINMGPLFPQKLNKDHNQSIQILYNPPVVTSTDREISLYTTDKYASANIKSAKSDNDIYLQTTVNLNLPGGENISLAGLTDTGEEFFPDMIQYTIDLTDTTFKKDGDSYIYDVSIDNNGGELSLPLHFTDAVFSDNVSDNSVGIILPIRVLNSAYSTWKLCPTLFKSLNEDDSDGVSTDILPIGYTDQKDCNHIGEYYLNLCKDNLLSEETPFSDCQLKLSLYAEGEPIGDPETITLQVSPPFSYYYNPKIEIDQKLLETKIIELDKNHIFDYTYVPLKDSKIEDPLNSKTFFNKSHICNEFVIPQIAEVTIKMMNKRN